MKSNGKLFIIIYIVVENLRWNQGTDYSHPDGNLFQEVNENLETVVGHFLTLLKVDQNFFEKDKIKLLVKLNSHSLQISEYNFKIYKDIKKASKVEVDNTTVNFISNLTEYLDGTINFVVEQEFYKANALIKNATFSKKNDLNFVTDFIDIVDKLTLEDIVGPASNARNIKLSKRKRHNIQVWYPANSTEDELQPKKTRRIFQGKPTTFKKFPFIASIHVLGKFTCGSSIISKEFAITAASCLNLAYNNQYERGNPDVLAVRVGSDYSKQLGELVPIIDVHFHPYYQPSYLRNNLAIAQFRIKPYLRKKLNIMRIQYERMEGPLPEDITQIVMVGWGDKYPHVSMQQDQLSYTHIDVFNLNLCMDTYSRQFVNDKNFCAGFTKKGAGACHRDVGGPAVISGILIGVVSFGPPICGTPDAPTVFTNIGYYVQWIDGILSKISRPSSEIARLMTTTERRPDEKQEISKLFKALRSKESPLSWLPESLKSVPETLEYVRNFLRTLKPEDLPDVNDLLYGELENDTNSFWTTTEAPDILHHPLVNNSISLEPEVSLPPEVPTTTLKSIIEELYIIEKLLTVNNMPGVTSEFALPPIKRKKDLIVLSKEYRSSAELSPTVTEEYWDSGYDYAPFQPNKGGTKDDSLNFIGGMIQDIDRIMNKSRQTTKKMKVKTKTRRSSKYEIKLIRKLNSKTLKETTLRSDSDEKSTTKRKTRTTSFKKRKTKTTLIKPNSLESDYDEQSTTKSKSKVTSFKKKKTKTNPFKKHTMDSNYDEESTTKHRTTVTSFKPDNDDDDEQLTTKRKSKKKTTLASDYDDGESANRFKTKAIIFQEIRETQESDFDEYPKLTFKKTTKKNKKHSDQTLKTRRTHKIDRTRSHYTFKSPVTEHLTTPTPLQTLNEFEYEDLRHRIDSYFSVYTMEESMSNLRLGAVKKDIGSKSQLQKAQTTTDSLKYEDDDASGDSASSGDPSRRSLLDYIILD